MIVYTNRCLKCSERKRWNELRKYAKAHNLPLEERRITVSKEWREESERYDLDLPFIVNGKQAISFKEPLDKLEVQ